MDNNIDLKELWAKQTATPPDTQDLLLKVKKLKRSHMATTILTNALLACTTAFIVFICVHQQPQLLTTKIGIVLTILAMVIFIVASNKLFPVLKKINSGQSNSDYLKSLLVLRTKQHYLQTTIMNLYFITLSIGIGLYMIEYTLQMPLWGAVVTYAATSAWILFTWFYLRPKQIAKQKNKLNELIVKFEILNKQFQV